MTTGWITNKIKELKVSRYPYWFKTADDFQTLSGVWYKELATIDNYLVDEAFKKWIEKDEKKKPPSPDDIKALLNMPKDVSYEGFSAYYLTVKDVYAKTMPSGCNENDKHYDYDYAVFSNWMGLDILKNGGTRKDINHLNSIRRGFYLPEIKKYSPEELREFMRKGFGYDIVHFVDGLKQAVKEGDVTKVSTTLMKQFNVKVKLKVAVDSSKQIQAANDNTFVEDVTHNIMHDFVQNNYEDTGFNTGAVSPHYADEF
jgi:hypothetical protein